MALDTRARPFPLTVVGSIAIAVALAGCLAGDDAASPTAGADNDPSEAPGPGGADDAIGTPVGNVSATAPLILVYYVNETPQPVPDRVPAPLPPPEPPRDCGLVNVRLLGIHVGSCA